FSENFRLNFDSKISVPAGYLTRYPQSFRMGTDLLRYHKKWGVMPPANDVGRGALRDAGRDEDFRTTDAATLLLRAASQRPTAAFRASAAFALAELCHIHVDRRYLSHRVRPVQNTRG